MNPVIAVTSAWLLFGGSHLLLSWPWVRIRLGNRLGERGFVILYALIAAVSLILLSIAAAYYGGDGPRGPSLATIPMARWSLGFIAFVGTALTVAGLANYSRSPMAVLARRIRQPDNIGSKPLANPAHVERITRHPFFVGIAILMGAHVLLASTLSGAVFFAGFVLLALIGIPMQDRKLRARHGTVYRGYLEKSSVVPFAAALDPNDRTSTSSPVWPIAVTSIAGAILFALLHPVWTMGYGAIFVALVNIGGLFAVAKQLRRSVGASSRLSAGNSEDADSR